jgi:hypothetical protein
LALLAQLASSLTQTFEGFTQTLHLFTVAVSHALLHDAA